MIEDFKKHIPAEIAQESGKVFYSGREAFSGERPLYILGYNPGGDPEEPEHATETVMGHTQKVLSKAESKWSAFRDESWKNQPPGQYLLQRRVRHLLERLSFEPGAVPASNLIFVRSKTAADLAPKSNHLQDLCWGFHQAVIGQLRVQVILCWGGQAAAGIKKKTGAQELADHFIATAGHPSHRKNLCYSNAAGRKVIQLAHPSWSPWTNPAADPTDLVKRALKL